MYQTYYVYIDKDYDPCFLMFSKKNIIIFWHFTLEKSVNAITHPQSDLCLTLDVIQSLHKCILM